MLLVSTFAHLALTFCFSFDRVEVKRHGKRGLAVKRRLETDLDRYTKSILST